MLVFSLEMLKLLLSFDSFVLLKPLLFLLLLLLSLLFTFSEILWKDFDFSSLLSFLKSELMSFIVFLVISNFSKSIYLIIKDDYTII